VGLLSALAVIGTVLKRFFENQKQKKSLEVKNKIIAEERERSDDLLLNILPASIATELKASGKARARRYERASVMFTDFKSFTKISEQLAPEELVYELDHYFKAFDNIIKHYGLEKIKTIGDAYMCASGLSDKASNPNNIILAALEIQEFLLDMKKEKSYNSMPYFEARIGIHTGPVVAGVVGINKFSYDIWGDTVNIAARIQENCEPGKINISEATFWEAKYTFKCLHRGKLLAKNKGMIDMYYVENKL
jgi:adenylate cyclase